MEKAKRLPPGSKLPSFTELVNLASARLGGKAIQANDEFFAQKENLLKVEAPIFIPDKYTSNGKWMDGWETRRRREPGHDWCVIQLGLRGVVRGVDVETTHFVGNYPEHVSMEGCDGTPTDEKSWEEILPRFPLKGNTHNYFPVGFGKPLTRLRLHIYPDGGVARLRAYGEVVPDWSAMAKDALVDLAGVQNGGVVIECSDMTFSSRGNLILPDRPKNMGDGWETRRRRGPGNDWVVIKLGRCGTIRRVEVDTTFFKGNAPAFCSLEGGLTQKKFSSEILPQVALKPNARHVFEAEVRRDEQCAYARFNIYPDGGVARLRLYGMQEA